jgi:hypothetical protein
LKAIGPRVLAPSPWSALAWIINVAIYCSALQLDRSRWLRGKSHTAA